MNPLILAAIIVVSCIVYLGLSIFTGRKWADWHYHNCYWSDELRVEHTVSMFATGFLWPIMLPAWWIKNWNDSGGLVEFIVPSLKKEQQEKERADIAAKGRKETVDLYKKLNLEIPEWLK